MTIHYTISLILFVATALSTSRLPKWWIKVIDTGRFQIALTMTLLLGIGIFTFDFSEISSIIITILLIVGIGYHAYRIYPFTPFHQPELMTTQERTNPIRLMAYNVRMSNEKYGKLLATIEKYQPAIVVLTEVNKRWKQAIIALKNTYPHQLIHSQEDGYGIALYSKIPLDEVELKFLVEDNIPSIHAKLTLNGTQIQVIGMHPCPPTPWTIEEHKDMEMIKVAGLVNSNILPSIVTGDLNDVGWSKITNTFKEISGLKDPRIGRGFYNTYNANIPLFRYPIDHFFVSAHFKLLELKRMEAIGSDHYPVFIELNLEV